MVKNGLKWSKMVKMVKMVKNGRPDLKPARRTGLSARGRSQEAQGAS